MTPATALLVGVALGAIGGWILAGAAIALTRTAVTTAIESPQLGDEIDNDLRQLFEESDL